MAPKVIKRNANIANLNSGISEETLFFDGDGENEDFVMDISQENTSAILNELTDLSSNPGAYAIRETYSNAYDAVMATGDMTRPIEVIIPMADEFSDESLAYKLRISECPVDLVRYATVTDHGIGMSTEDLRKFFTQYGGTKKQGANLIGSKGLGSKAPLSCADFFDVITVKDGIRSIAHLWRGNGHNYAKIVKVEPTDDGNGTTVRIPIVDPKIATEMSECMDSIAKWNLDANLTYNGEHRTSFLSEQMSSNGKNGYIFLGNVVIGVDEDGEDVRVRMWQSIKTFPRRLSSHVGYGWGRNAGKSYINWNMNVDLNLCGVRYLLASDGRVSDYDPDIIVAGDPGYLNFTPSRDEVKDDDAKKEFLDAISDAEYDCDAVIKSMLSGEYGNVANVMLKRDGFVRESGSSKELIINSETIGTLGNDILTSFDGIDMSDYVMLRKEGSFAPLSHTRYYSVTKLSRQGYIAPIRHMDGDTINSHSTGYSIGRSGTFSGREIADRMLRVSPLPLVAIIPSPMLSASNDGRFRSSNAHACQLILNSGDNHAVVITGPRPSWKEFQGRESGIRRIISAKTGQDMTNMAVTYLFLDGGKPTKQDMLALDVFAHVTVTTWDSIVKDIRDLNRTTRVPGKAKTAPMAMKLGSLSTTSYDLHARRSQNNRLTPFESPIDALLGDAPFGKNVVIDFDNDDLSGYVFAIGDGGSPETVARIASAMAMAGLLGEADTLCFVSSTASATTSYALNMNEVKALVKNRDMRILADLRVNRSHFPSIIDGIDGIDMSVKGGCGAYRVASTVSLEVLGVTEQSYENLSYVLSHDATFSRIGRFVINCHNILGTTFSDDFDAILSARSNSWWTRALAGRSYWRSGSSLSNMSLVTPKDWAPMMDSVKEVVSLFHEVSQINGIQSLAEEAVSDEGGLAKAVIAPGLQSVIGQHRA